MSILIALIIFGVLIFIHEFGHFIIAKKNGVRVVEFSIGMGPRLFSFVKGDTKYSLKILPFGGACQMQNKEFEGEENVVMDQEKSFESKSVWSRMAIIFAGPFFNFILAFVLALILIGIIGYDPAIVTDVTSGSPMDKAGIKEGDIITEFNGESIDIARELYLETYVNPISNKKINITYERDGKEYTTTVKPEYVEKYVIGITYMPDDNRVVISDVSDNSPAKKAGLKKNDVITAINGVEVTSGKQYSQYMQEHPFDGSEATLTIERDGKEQEIKITPVKGSAGYSLGYSYNMGRVKTSPLNVIKYSCIEIEYQIKTVFKSLGMLVTGKLGVDAFTGPVGIVDIIDNVYEETRDEGTLMVILNLFNMAILLSANLGVMNLLPIPGLDGGRLLFLIIEAIKGKPVKHEEYVHLAGMLLLMAFAVFILFKDIFSLF